MVKRKAKSPRNVVLVLSETARLASLSNSLSGNRIKTHVFKHAVDALAFMKDNAPPQLVVSDLILPGIDGLQLSHLLRSEEYSALNKVPVLIVSTLQEQTEDSFTSLNIGPFAYMVSSANEHHLKEIITDLLQDQSSFIPRVLIVENSKAQSVMLGKTCESGGYTVDIASTAANAEEAVREHTYDLAVLDYHLPDGTGDSLLKTIHNSQPDCICFMITADSDPALAVEWMQMGANAYLLKPFAPDYLLQMCARARQERSILAAEKLLRKKSQQLYKSEERHKAILSALPDAIFRINKDLCFIGCHTDTPELLLAPPEEFIGKPVSAVLPPALAENTEKYCTEVLKTGSTERFEYELEMPDTSQYYEARMVPCGKDEILAIVRDITDQKLSQAALENNSRLLQTFLDHTPAMVSIFDHEGRYLKANRSIAEFYNLAPEQLEGKLFQDLLPPENSSLFMKRMQKILDTQNAVVVEDTVQIENRPHTFQSILFPITTEDNSLILFGSIATDISEQVKTHQQLQLHTDALNAAANAIVITDRDGNILWVNPAYSELTGYTQEEILGQNPRICQSGFQDEAFYKEMWEHILSGNVWRGEIINKRKNGAIYQEEMTITPVRSQDNKVSHFIAVKQDITERSRTIAVNKARSHLMEYSQDHTTYELLEESLNEAEKISGSLIAFFHFIEEEQGMVTLQNWSTQTKDSCFAADLSEGHYSIDEAGVWIDCFHQRKPVIHNNLHSLENLKGMPEGHARIERELTVPIFRDGKIAAILGVGNKPIDYSNADVEAVSLLASIAWDLVERKQAEEARAKIETLLDETQNLSGIGGWEWDISKQQMTWTDQTYRIHDIEPGSIPQGSNEHIEHSLECYEPEDRARIMEAFALCVNEGVPYDLECQLTSTKGRKLWVRTIGKAKRSEGEIVQVHGYIYNITAQKEALQALERSELRFRNLARNAPGIVFQYVVTEDGTSQLEFVTDQVTAILGIPLSNGMENVLSDFLDRCHTDDLSALKQSIKDAVSDKSSWHYEGRFYNLDGDIIWLQGAANPRQVNGSLYFEGIIFDISERKNTELALQESEHKFRSLMEQAVEMLFLHETDGRIVDVNRASIETTGYSREELLSMTVFDIDPDAGDREDPKRIWEELSPDNPPFIFEVRHQRKDGSIYPAEVILTKVILADHTYMFSLARDITQRKKAEIALRESEQKYRSLAETTIDWVFSTDRQGKLTYASSNVSTILGYEVDEVVGKRITGFMEAEEAKRVDIISKESIAEKKPMTAFEIILLHKNGSEVFVETNAVPQFDENGDFTGYFGTFRDITPRKEDQEALRQREEELRKAQHVAQIGSWRIDPVNESVYGSEEARRIYGVKNRNLSFDDIEMIPLPEYRSLVNDSLTRLMENDEPYDIEFRIRRPSDSALRYVHSLAEYDPEQKLVIGTIQDTTDRVEAEQALKESETLLRTVAANFPNAYLAIIKKDLTVAFASGQEFAVQNLDPQEIIEKPLSEIFPKYGLVIEEHCLKTFQGESVQFELFVSNQYLRFRSVPLKDIDDKVNQILVVAEDISDERLEDKFKEQRLLRKQRQAEVLAMVASSPHLARGNIQELAREITEAASLAMEVEWADIWLFSGSDPVIDNIDRFEYSSNRHLQELNIPEQVVQEKLLRIGEKKSCQIEGFLDSPQEVPGLEKYLQENSISASLNAVIRTGKSDLGMICFEQVDIQQKWEEDEINFACQLADQIALALSNRDRRLVEAERERFIKAIEQSGEIFIITDADNRIQYVNKAFENTTGYTQEEALGNTPRMLQSGKHDRTFYQKLWNDLDSGTSWKGRFINRKKDGTLYTESAAISPVADTDGNIINYIAVKRDISEQLQLEREKERIEEQYRHTQRVEAIGRLAGGVAHDLNNLLTPILLYSEMLLDEFDPDTEHNTSINGIFEAGKRARDLVNQLLAFSRKQNLEYKLVDLNQTIEDFSHLLRRTIREDIQIEAVLGPVDRFIKADIGQIEQVVMNLAVNAQDAMPNGGLLTLETSMADLDQVYVHDHPGVKPGLYVMLAVSDTGVGMNEKIQQRIFEPFFSTKGEAGTGLGLATVYGIVKQHTGDIWVYSEPEKGTTFKIFLPADKEIQPGRKPYRRKLTPQSGTETILLVEDNDQVRELTLSILERQGYKVLSAENGPSALKILDNYQDRVHLLLTDVVMPEMNGRELYLSSVQLQPNIKVLYMSGYTDDVIAHQGVLEEGLAFIQKPFSVEGLTNSVRNALEKENRS